MAQQQAHKLAQLHRTIAVMANMLDRQTALQEAQWRGMKTWLEEKEQKRDAYHQDDMLWGKDITDMVLRVVAATERSQREERKADTEGVGLEASIQAYVMQTGRPKMPEERQQLQPGRQVRVKQTPKTNPEPTPPPTPRSTSTLTALMTLVPILTRRWETDPPQNQKKLASPAPAPTTGSSLADRLLVLRRDDNVPLPNKMDQEIASAINSVLFHQQAPAHSRSMNARRNAKGVITAITPQNGTAEMAL